MTPRIAAAIALLSVAAAWAFGHTHPFGDPRAERLNTPGSLLEHTDLPPSARAVLLTKCADCHSDQTHWPIYARLAPGSWLIERDVIEGRKHMNLSHFQELSPEQRDTLRSEIVQQTKGKHMPPLQYRLIHWNARLSPQDVQALALLRKTETLLSEASTQPGDAVHGKVVFEKRCTGCHALTTNREGPQLAGVFGRLAGSVPGFTYSADMRRSGLTWNDTTLDRWLADPDTMVPDNSMGVNVPKAKDRRDIIAYLRHNE